MLTAAIDSIKRHRRECHELSSLILASLLIGDR
jgi:hypothetical protein